MPKINWVSQPTAIRWSAVGRTCCNNGWTGCALCVRESVLSRTPSRAHTIAVLIIARVMVGMAYGASAERSMCVRTSLLAALLRSLRVALALRIAVARLEHAECATTNEIEGVTH